MGGRARTGRPMLEHSVGAPGLASYMTVFPVHDFGVIIAVNRRDSGNRIGMLIKLWKRFLTNRVAGWWAV